MQLVHTKIYTTHRFLAGRLFYPLAFSSLLACSFYVGRVVLSGSWDFFFLNWNLLLAWVPYLCSLYAASLDRRYPGQWWRLLAPGALWLLFFPNAPYIMTDFVHYPRMDFRWWYDVAFLASYAWTGCFLGVASLHSIQSLVRSYLGAAVSWLFVLAAIGLSGLGVYLGRFLRWNSWDVFVEPRSVLSELFALLANPLDDLRMLGVSAMFAALLLICYVTYVGAMRREA